MHQILVHENIHFEKNFKNLTKRKSKDNIQRLEKTLNNALIWEMKPKSKKIEKKIIAVKSEYVCVVWPSLYNIRDKE